MQYHKSLHPQNHGRINQKIDNYFSGGVEGSEEMIRTKSEAKIGSKHASQAPTYKSKRDRDLFSNKAKKSPKVDL